MRTLEFPYGKEKLTCTIAEKQLVGVLTSQIGEYVPAASPAELVKKALINPIGSPSLTELAKGKKNVVIIASDHTRPVPSKVIIPPMLEAIRAGAPDAEITIMIATGLHRPMTHEEQVERFGPEIVRVEDVELLEDLILDQGWTGEAEALARALFGG